MRRDWRPPTTPRSSWRAYRFSTRPWLRLPLDDRRRTGLLWPDFGNDSSGGLDISVPVYFNLAPNYDALYAPRYIEERGLDHQLQLRYLNPLVGEWLVGGAYLKER